MPRPAVTAGAVARIIRGAIAGGLPAGTFEVWVSGGLIRIIPFVQGADPADAESPNPWDDDLPREEPVNKLRSRVSTGNPPTKL